MRFENQHFSLVSNQKQQNHKIHKAQKQKPIKSFCEKRMIYDYYRKANTDLDLDFFALIAVHYADAIYQRFKNAYVKLCVISAF